jgi:hypothetical protein
VIKTKKTEEEYQVDLQKTVHELSGVKEQLVLSKEDKERMNKYIEKLTSDLKVYLIFYLFNKNKQTF